MNHFELGHHFCHNYNDCEEYISMVEKIMRIAITNTYKVIMICLSDIHTELVPLVMSESKVKQALQDRGIDIVKLCATGQIEFLNFEAAYLKKGKHFDPDIMYALWDQEIAKLEANSEGYNALCGIAEMSWAMLLNRSKEADQVLFEYESKLTDIFLKMGKITVFCLYHTELFPDEMLCNVLSTHPKAIVDQAFFDNFYYIPPAEFSRSAKFKHWTKNLTARKDLDQTINTFTTELMVANEKLRSSIAARQALEHDKQAAEVANKQKADFISIMSHEIRTPLNCVRASIDLMLMTAVNNEQKECLDMMHVGTNHLITVLGDILDASCIERGNFRLETTPTSLYQAIGMAQQTYKQAFPFNFVREVHPDVPLVLVDNTRLTQILFNLMGNSCKFSNPGTEICISANLAEPISDSSTSAVVRFKVQDHGAGIAPEIQAKLFTPFTQGDVSTTRQFGGSGLGLSICKNLVRAMGGDIWFESEVNEGATFWFDLHLDIVKSDTGEILYPTTTFPLFSAPSKRAGGDSLLHICPPSPPLSSGDVKEVASVSDVRQKSRKSVLVVEDNLMNQKVILRLLSKFGIFPTLVNNGAEAVEITKHLDFEIIFMDLHMPVMDGFTATQLIRAQMVTRRMRSKIVALTASISPEDRKRCAECGIDLFISKPFKVEHLQKVVE